MWPCVVRVPRLAPAAFACTLLSCAALPLAAQQAPQNAPDSTRSNSLGATEPVQRNVPYQGAIGPVRPPRAPLPPMQKPLEPWVTEALEVWWMRPSPKGPDPIALEEPKAIFVKGKSPVIQALPGPPVFPEKIPERLQAVYPDKVPFSNNVEVLSKGDIRIAAVDRTLNDTKLSKDWMAFEANFTDAKGAEWRIEQVTLAPLSPNPIAEPWLGGLGIDVKYHGHTGNGTPAVPLVNCAICSWGWADVYKNGKRVASSALLHVMVTSDTRNDENGFKYYDYDSTSRPIREVHVIIPPSAYLPSPGGFLHVMWENAEITRAEPQKVQAMAKDFTPDVPTIELSAVPYLQWDQTDIKLEARRKYRLVVHNNDPSSFHQFSLHSRPQGHGKDRHADDLRHEHGGTAGRIGGLWRPGASGHGHSGGDPPAPRNVFFPLPQGSTWATMIQFEEPGEYSFMCPVGNHFRRGMHGKFVVTGTSAKDQKNGHHGDKK